MSYAAYQGDSRSSWEKHGKQGWVSLRPPHVQKIDIPERKKEIEDFKRVERELEQLLDKYAEIIAAHDISHQERIKKSWAHIGYVIFGGILVTLIGIAIGFVSPTPAPIAIAAMGMTAVVIALWYGGKLEHPA